MKTTQALCAALLLGCATMPLFTQEPEDVSATPVVLGIYDSRVLAVAYFRSVEFEKQLDALQGSATGEEMQALQERMHRQGFGTAPIPGILSRIEEEYEAIAQETGVDVIVNRWALDYRGDKVQAVDISFRMAQGFSPSEDTLKVMRDLTAQEPATDEQLRHPH